MWGSVLSERTDEQLLQELQVARVHSQLMITRNKTPEPSFESDEAQDTALCAFDEADPDNGEIIGLL